MSTSINALYALEDKGAIYCYFPRYHEAELATNILHEVSVTDTSKKTSKTSVDFTHSKLISRSTFLKWIQMGMPDREEYNRVFNASEEDSDVLVPLTASMIDELFLVYKHK